ncbi:MAG: hypothetical protein QM684_21825 [Rhizobium sp.]
MMERRTFLAGAPALAIMPATALAESDGPVIVAYRRWLKIYRHSNSGGFTDEEMEGLCDMMAEAADDIMSLPSKNPLDLVAKLAAATDNLESEVPIEWKDCLCDEIHRFLAVGN